MRLAGALLLIAIGHTAQAAGFRAEALMLVQSSDFQGLQDLADRLVTASSIALTLKTVPDSGAQVDWSILIHRIGVKPLNAVFGSGAGDFLTWLVQHPDALQDYIHGGTEGEINLRSFQVWHTLWRDFTETREPGPWRNFAIASALVQAQQVYAMADGKPIDPVARYRFFRESAEQGALVPSFTKAPVWQLRYVAGSWAMDSDLAWVRAAMKPDVRNQFSVGDACMMVPYRETNAQGVSVQSGSKFYDEKPMTLQLMTEYGGVCGAISRFGASSAQALGVPAFPIAQPGHCAFVWENAESSWKLGNDVYGWGASSQHDGIRLLWGTRPVFIPLYNRARRDEKAFLTADRLTYAATLNPHKESILRSATLSNPLFLPAWQRLTQLQPTWLAGAAKALGTSPFAVSDLFVGAKGDNYLVALKSIAMADSAPQLGTQAWAAAELVARKVFEDTGKSLDVFGVIQCKEKHFRWAGTDGPSQAVVKAAIRAVGSRDDISSQLEKLLYDDRP